MKDEILKISNCTYVNYNQIEKKFYRLLDDINLVIRKNEIHFVIGESGSSKSSLVDVVSGIKDCYPGLINGSIEFNDLSGKNGIEICSTLKDSKIYKFDKKLENLYINRRRYNRLQKQNSKKIKSVYEGKLLSVIHQQNKEFLNPFLTMKQFLNRLNISQDEKKKFYDLIVNTKVIKSTIDDFNHKKPDAFSGGQKMRINIALAFCLNSDLLIADEPTTGIDDDLKDIFISNFWENIISNDKKSYLVVTHDFDFLYSILNKNKDCNNQIFIHTMFGGQLIQSLDLSKEDVDDLHPYVNDLFKLSYDIKADNKDLYIDSKDRLLKNFVPHDNSINRDFCSYYHRCFSENKNELDCRYDKLNNLDVKCRQRIPYKKFKNQIENFKNVDYNNSSSNTNKIKILIRVDKKYKKEFFKPESSDPSYTLLAQKDLLFYKNYFNFIIGESGSGKSTLLKSIAGLLNINSKIVEINNSVFNINDLNNFTDINEILKNRNILRSLQYVFQETCIAFNTSLNCYEIINEAYDNLYPEESNKDKKRLTIELLNKIGIHDNKLYQVGSHLSGGEIKRLLLARSFAALGYGLDKKSYSKVLLVDELTTGYDILNQELILDFIKSQIKEMNLTYIIASHNMNLIYRCENKVVYKITVDEEKNHGIIE